MSFPIASFVGEACLGNRHRVFLDPGFSSPSDRDAWLRRAGETIVVLLFTKDHPHPRAEFFQFGHSILRCGSGTLAAAHVLFRHLNCSGIQLLDTAGGKLALQCQGEWLGYTARGLPVLRNDDWRPWQALVNQTISSCWNVGGEQDYCLVELAGENTLRDLQVDTEALKQSSERALIATARSATDRYDYVLRYFAPRHGKSEDAATGSANLQVADFWRERLNSSRLRGRQLSVAGGEFILQVNPDCTWVMGRTMTITKDE